MSKKKIFDIAPPQEVQKIEEIAISWKPKKDLKKALILITAGIILIGILGFIFITPEAEIEIWPKKEQVIFETQGSISGEIFKIEKNVSREFLATGARLKTAKAKGTIRVYNTYSSAPQSLIATTRFVSDDGKLFRTPKRVLVPGAQDSIDIIVEADQPGEDYNIGPSTFSIPGFAGTARYTAFYAKSFEPMTGGFKVEISEVTKKDLENAMEILSEEALQESKKALKETVPADDYIIADEAIAQEIIEFTPLIEEGQEAEKFSARIKTEAEALAFKESELSNFAKSYIRSQISSQKDLDENSLQIKYTVGNVDLENGKVILELEISGQIYSAINQNKLKEMIKNKRKEEINRVFDDFSGISKTKIKLRPFWSRMAPFDSEKIKIILNLD